jgi:hypothetical protein
MHVASAKTVENNQEGKSNLKVVPKQIIVSFYRIQKFISYRIFLKIRHLLQQSFWAFSKQL